MASGWQREASTAKALLKQISTVYFLGFMCDFALSALSQAFQSDSISLSGVMDELDATIAYLQSYNTTSHSFTSFLPDFDNIEEPIKFPDRQVKGGKKDMDFAKRSIQQLVTCTIVYI